jgi:hypothetical protein
MLDAKEREFVDMQVLEKKIFFQYFWRLFCFLQIF